MSEVVFSRALRKNWLLIVIVTAAAAAATAIVTALQEPVYESSAQLVVAPRDNPGALADVIRSLETLERRTVVATFARIAATDDVRRAAADAVKLSRSEARRYQTTGSVIPSTNIVRVTVTGPNAAAAAELANAAAALTARRSESLYRMYSLPFLARATPPRSPLYPDRQRNYIVGTAVGIVLGIAAALISDRLRRSGSAQEP